MSITSAELIAYCSASRPTDDVSTTGGAIDALRRPVFTQFSSSAKLSLTSSASDTRNVTVTGRLAAGDYISETVALNGTTEVLSTNTYERILIVDAASTNSNTVTLKQGSGGSTIGTIPANERGVTAMFINSASSSSGSSTRYEKFFWKNTDGSLTLTSATITLTADPSSKITISLAGSLNDSATVANRTTSPGGSFSGVGVALNVANSQNLSSGAGQGVWVLQTLAQNDAALKSTFTTQLQGNTT